MTGGSRIEQVKIGCTDRTSHVKLLGEHGKDSLSVPGGIMGTNVPMDILVDSSSGVIWEKLKSKMNGG